MDFFSPTPENVVRLLLTVKFSESKGNCDRAYITSLQTEKKEVLEAV